jgi:DNA modification methylase
MVIVIFIGVGELKMMIYIIGKKNYFQKNIFEKNSIFRLKEISLKVTRPPSSIGRYRMLQHTKRTPSIWNKRYG